MIKGDQEALICISTTRKIQAADRQVYPEKDFYSLVAKVINLEIQLTQYDETLFLTIPRGERLNEFLKKLYELAGGREAFYHRSSAKERG